MLWQSDTWTSRWRLVTLLLTMGVLVPAGAAQPQGKLTAVAPRWVRPQSEFHVAVTVQGAGSDTAVHVQLDNNLEDGRNQSYAQDITVPANSTRRARLQVPAEALPYLPERLTMKRTFNRRRQRHLPQNPKTIEDLGHIPDEFKLTTNRKTFLCYDSYEEDDGDDDDEEEEDRRRRRQRTLIFASKAALRILATSQVLQLDGTFETAPDIFAQIVTVHGDYRGETLPLVYVLLPDKNQVTYTRMLTAVVNACERYGIRRPHPTTIITDFEKGLINAGRALFRDAVVRLCLFHLRQSAFRKIQEHGLMVAYRDENDSTVRDAFRTIVGVAFVPTEDVEASFQEARQTVPARMDAFADYFDATYVMGRRLRGRRPVPPRYPPAEWNQHQAALNGEPRTINTLEAWHNRFQVGDLGAGKLSLSVRSEGGVHFENTTEVELHAKSVSLLIQTDKVQYKPGHAVKLRVLALDAHLRPTVSQPLHVYITDGKKNRVKQWRDVSAPRGVWSAELPLSERPVLGDWTITAALQTDRASSPNKVTKSFRVAEYVLPTFEVTATVPAINTFKQGTIVLTIKAKYTYGKPVVGTANIRVPLPYDYPLLPHVWVDPADPTATTVPTTTKAPQPTHLEKVVPIDGTATVEFDIKRELMLDESRFWSNRASFEVTVEEALTGRKMNASAQAEVRVHDFNIEFVNTPYNFKGGQKFSGFVKLTNLDGSPIREGSVTLHIGRFYSEVNATSEVKSIPPTGLVEFTVDTEVNQTVISIKAEYRNKTEWRYVNPVPTKTGNSLEAELVKETPKEGEEVAVLVSSTVPLQLLSYAVLGPLDLVQAESVDGQGQREVTLRFTATPDMAPASRLIIHALTEDGELLAVNKDIELATLPDKVLVEVRPTRSEPGGYVDVRVSAPPNSTVAVLAVDQSVLLLGDSASPVSVYGEPASPSRSQLSKESIRDERLSYDPTHSGRPTGPRSGTSWGSWATTTQEAIRSAGASYLTNARVEQMRWGIMYESIGGAPGGGVLFGAKPQAVAFAASASGIGMVSKGGAVEVSVAPRVRSLFPETWLWEQMDSVAGNVTFQSTVPDTITSWVVTALAVDPVHGLGLSESSNLTVFRPFFVSLNLPYSVIRGETVSIPVLVFNYMDSDMEASVTLENNGEFEFATNSGRARREDVAAVSQQQHVKVRGQNAASVSFNITPKMVGYVTLKVTATGDRAGDAVERKLRVKAEGETQYRNKAIPIDLQREKTFNTSVTIDVPENAVPGSENVEVSAVGDILGPSAANLDSLLRMPYGCGEQNMLSFVPNIVIMDYLKHIRQSNPELERKARSFTEVGYQRELTYRHKDGSFSAFGESDRNGSTWLTAFVAKSFMQAKAFVDVEDRVVDEAMSWLSKQQAANGSFPEVGTVSHQSMQGGAARGLALTAYVLITFLQSQDATYKYQDTVKKTLEYLVSNLDGLDDPYAIAITSYALQLANHPSKEVAFKLLQDKARVSGEYRWWNKTEKVNSGNPYADLPNSVDVEMTSYALMTYLQRGLVQDALPIMQWLIAQRNSNGGFASTQDTVVGLQALVAMAERISFDGGNMRVIFSHGAARDAPKNDTTVVINSISTMILQKHEVPRQVRHVDVAADGAGFALAQVSWSYNEDTKSEHPLFNLRVDVDNTTDTATLKLRVCSSFVPGPHGSESNMAVLEVSLPSGFVADQEELSALEHDPNVRLVETKEQDTVLVLYFDKMESAEYCIDVAAVRMHLVTHQKPVPVTVYDYYDQTRRARVFYKPPPADVMDKI